ncbi:MAG: hypothetical protein A2Y40_04930 [Candidatus Margulisbacteria bacterium GWF2_35_9]|nr:MAG: hypothetical protein A2Y40_04930 [Candidatus Margulisbacteria bacterium GWF2_35_9]
MNKKLEIIQLLKKNGVKTTPQRLAIITFLENNLIHPSAEQIYETLKKDFPTMSLATIYNTLDKLNEIKKVIKINFSGDNKVHYDYNTHFHYHFLCNICNNIYDITPKEKPEMLGAINDGHHIEETHTYFKGICKSCFTKRKGGKNEHK